MFNRGLSRKLRIERLEDRRVLAADFNGDETVDVFDLAVFQFGYGTVDTAAQTQGDADGDFDVDGRDFLQWQREVGPKQNNLIAYRPQGVYDPDDTSTPDPIYDPFPKRPVSAADEFSSTLGPGIRINHDDDNNSGTPDATEIGTAITRENDLIEVKVERLPGQGHLILQPTGALSLYFDHAKETPIPLNGSQTEPLPFTNDSVTVFVEWQAPQHGTSILGLLDATTFATLDSVRFHSFRSLVVVFGGDGQNPSDTDGDGSIGDPVEGANREGIFDVAQSLYDTGWDVLAFNEEAEELGDDLPTTEIINARQQRFVERHAVIGYSHGGGATHDLIEELFRDYDITTTLGVYLDAVDQFGINEENDWPDVTFYLLNIYEQISFLNGGAINTTVTPGSVLEEINTTIHPNFNNNLDHFDIDDDLDVQQLIRTVVLQVLQFR